MNKKIYIYANDSETSKRTKKQLKQKLDNSGFVLLPKYTEKADLLVCIGGDGTFLEAIHKFDFPTMPIIGINTGHLGFFQDAIPFSSFLLLKCASLQISELLSMWDSTRCS